MSVETRYDEDGDVYHLGDEIEGVFVSFVDLDAGEVRRRIENAKALEGGGETQTETETGDVPTQPAAG